MAPPVLGIDLGTTNSAVAVATTNGARALRDEDGRSLIPSVVSFHPTGKVVVGYPARERRLNDARNTVYSVKRLIGRPYNSPEVRRARDRFAFELGEGENGSTVVKTRAGSFALQEISAFVLRRVREVAEHALGMPCTSAVVTVPANFNELQRSATKAAGRIAGLDIKRILNEPTAAALAYGYGTGVKEKIAIYDLGGGTFDITILDLAGDVFEVLSTAGDTFLGGDDVDLLVAERMAQQFLEQHRYDLRTDAQGFERLRAAGEWVKCELSRVQEAHARVEEVAYDVGGTPLALDFKLGRAEFERMVTSMLGRTFDVCEEAMKIAGIRPTQLDNVILVGGSTRIPIVQRMVREYFGREPMSRIDPDLVVAQGAAIQAMALGGDEDLPTISPRPVARVPLKRTWVAPGSLPPPAGPAFAPLEEDNFTPGFTPEQARTHSADELETEVTFDEETSQDHDESEEFPTKSRIESPAERKPEQPAQFGRSLRPVPRDWRPPRPNEAGGEEPATTPRAPAAVDAMYPPIGGDEANELTDAPTKARSPAADALLEKAAFAGAAPAGPSRGPAPIFAESEVMDAPTKSAPAAPHVAVAQQPGVAPVESPRGARLPLPDLTNTGSQPPRAMNLRPPLLLDVTPLSLGIETVGGYCEHVISRNAAIPAEETRIFTTSRDDQDEVQVRISQGESRRLDDNLVLGEISLSRLRRAARGVVKIAVTFILDADGTLGVRAKDLETGRMEEVRVRLVGGLAREEEARLAARHAQMLQ